MEEAAAGSGKIMRLALVGLVVIVIAVAAVAAMFFLKSSHLEDALAEKEAEAAKIQEAADAAHKQVQQVQGDLKAANDKIAELQLDRAKADRLKMLLSQVEPQLDAWLEAAAQTKGAKPEARAAALTIVGLIGQVNRGANNATALAALDRALSIDKNNCVATLALGASGTRTVRVTPECAALLPAEAPKDAKDTKDAKDAGNDKSAATTKDDKAAAAPKEDKTNVSAKESKGTIAPRDDKPAAPKEEKPAGKSAGHP
jgi:hypothetical protein